MQESNYTYRFLNGDGLHYYIDNGILSTSGLPKIIRNAPDGWQQKSLQWERNKTDFGVIRSFTIPLKFVTDGAHILRGVFYQYGFEAVCSLIINELDPSTRQLKEIFRGDVDFTTFNDSNEFVTVNIIEGGLYKLIKANEGTPYEIPLNVPESILVKMDGMEIQQQAKFFLGNGATQNNGQHLLDCLLLTNESLVSFVQSVSRRYFADNTDLLSQSDFIVRTGNSTTTLRIKFDYGVTCTLAVGETENPAAGGLMLIRSFDDNGSVNSAFVIKDYGGASNFYQHHQLSGDVTVTIPANSRVYLCMFLTISGTIASGSGADQVVFWNYDMAERDFISLEYNYRHQTTYVKALKPNDVFSALTNKLTDNTYLSESELLNTTRKNFVLTTLNGLLGKPDIAVIKTTLNDFYKFCHTRFSATKYVDVNNKLRIEEIQNAFDSTIIFDIGAVRDLQIDISPDLLFNNLDAGYQTNTYDDVNGKYEFNALQKWKAPVTRVKTKLDMICPYRADPYGIEILRINLDGKDTTDNQGDNDVFILDVVSENNIQNVLLSFVSSGNYIVFPADPVVAFGTKFIITGTANNNETYQVTDVEYMGATQTVHTDKTITVAEFTVNCLVQFLEGQVFKLNRPAYSPITGVPDNTVFNVELSPKRGLINNGSLLRSMMWKLEPGLLKFQTGEKNTDLSTTLAGVTIAEKEDIEIGSLGNPLFIPVLFKFEPKADIDIMTILNTNPLGKIAFQYDGKNYYGFIMSINKQPATNSAQQWTLLASTDNNLNNFIHG